MLTLETVDFPSIHHGEINECGGVSGVSGDKQMCLGENWVGVKVLE